MSFYLFSGGMASWRAKSSGEKSLMRVFRFFKTFLENQINSDS